MQILVYGVTNWDNYKQAQEKKPSLVEWHERVKTFIPEWSSIFLTAGTYSPPEHNPLDCEIYQIPFYRPFQYSRQNCYFRTGFVTGIWKALMDYPHFDLLIHCQPQRYLGENLTDILLDFMNRDEQVCAPAINSSQLKGIDVGLMIMKRNAAMMYAASGRRQSCDVDPNVINVEEEANDMFKDTWYNPWPHIKTCKQIDYPHRFEYGEESTSPYDITNIEEFGNYPFIATEKHVTKEFYEFWSKKHPIT